MDMYRKSQNDIIVFGVCGGLAEYLNVDPTWVRIGVVFLTLFTWVPAVAYIAVALIAD